MSSSSTPSSVRSTWPSLSRRSLLWMGAGLLLLLGLAWGIYLQQRSSTLGQIDQKLERVEQLAYHRPEAARQLAQEAEQLAKAAQDDERLAISYYWHARLLLIDPRLQSDETSGLDLGRVSAKLIAPLARPAWMAQIYAVLCETAYLAKSLDSADRYLNQGLMMVEAIPAAPQDSMQALADLLTLQGVMLAEGAASDTHRLADALHTLNQAQRLYGETGDSLELLRSWVYEGQILREAQQTTAAEAQLQQALRWATRQDSLVLTPQIYRALALLHVQQVARAADPTVQAAQAEQALTAARQAVQLGQGAAQHHLLGQVYHRLASLLPAQRRAYLSQAGDAYLTAMNTTLMSHPDPYLLNQVVADYQQICAELGQCEFVLSLANTAFRSVNQEYRQAKDAAEQRLYRFEREWIERKAQNKRIGILAGAGGLLLLFGIWFWVRDQRLRLASLRQRTTARLETLQAQMNPHFLSNCLNAIEALINVNRNREASYYLVQFSRLSRLILSQSRKAEISLADELKVLEHYLRLERMRLDERLEFRIEVAPTLSPDDVAMPPMLLQPLVENAIWHGIQPKRGAGNLLIAFHHPSPRQLRCIIKDDGIGRVASLAQRKGSLPGKTSESTDIIQERLEILRQERHAELHYVDLHDENGHPAGTRVELTLSW